MAPFCRIPATDAVEDLGKVMPGLYHEPTKPEMDWWEKKGSTPGDRMLRSISRKLESWLAETHGIGAQVIPLPGA
ncbi:MAG: hypothetical protein ACXQTG_00290 [Methanoculleaceae archaeon]